MKAYGHKLRRMSAIPGSARTRKHTYVCNGCGVFFDSKPAQCRWCGRLDFEHFDSQSEAIRWKQLILLTKASDPKNRITELRRQVRFDLLAHGPNGQPVKAGLYVADFVYRRSDGKLAIEDTKPRGMIDDLAKLKLSIMEAMGKPVTVTWSE